VLAGTIEFSGRFCFGSDKKIQIAKLEALKYFMRFARFSDMHTFNYVLIVGLLTEQEGKYGLRN